MINTTLLAEYAEKLGITLDSLALERFDEYAVRLVETNKHLNLTAITEPDEITVKHFADSLSLLAYVNLQPGARVLDVGTGAGFPGAVLLAARPDLSVTLLDGTKKKLTFVEEALSALGLSATFVHARAEEAGRREELREGFDLVTARAVARLGELSEYCLPFTRVGGTFAAMKGIKPDEELGDAKRALSILGGALPEIKSFCLPDGSERNILLIKKISQTPTKYPRASAQISRRPLV